MVGGSTEVGWTRGGAKINNLLIEPSMRVGNLSLWVGWRVHLDWLLVRQGPVVKGLRCGKQGSLGRWEEEDRPAGGEKTQET